ncbi:hypothetical protein AKJ55_00595 [candidate division MSBL1 archaeon SCGC-AAA382M17]|uniref:Uncharacterized protein n=1 Tax=candidate division MSBL1 archaeon SCGC-AAA382M17 TaxID=1698284 RepID=A0ABR5TJV5_9EURY|nr:hypothetical protein AKJ55_00595 [candidate division MSBL1 archaeon SCGC-AAA382M17]
MRQDEKARFCCGGGRRKQVQAATPLLSAESGGGTPLHPRPRRVDQQPAEKAESVEAGKKNRKPHSVRRNVSFRESFRRSLRGLRHRDRRPSPFRGEDIPLQPGAHGDPGRVRHRAPRRNEGLEKRPVRGRGQGPDGLLRQGGKTSERSQEGAKERAPEHAERENAHAPPADQDQNRRDEDEGEPTEPGQAKLLHRKAGEQKERSQCACGGFRTGL